MVDHHVRILPASLAVAQRELGGALDDQTRQELVGRQNMMVAFDHLDQTKISELARLARSSQCTLRQASLEANTSFPSTLLVGTRGALLRLAQCLQEQPEQQALSIQIRAALERIVSGTSLIPGRIGQTVLNWGSRTYVMGIVNATPDSFSGDGLLGQADAVSAALEQALRFVAEGADIIDIGGESTRPGSAPVAADVELARVIPVIRALRRQTDVPISVDTYRASVARAALDVGANMVNDVWGLRMDPQMAPLVAESGAPVVIMHNRSRPKDSQSESRLGGRYVGVTYGNLMADIINELRDQIALGRNAGISDQQIIVDPGIGFGKTVEQNLYLINHLDELSVLGYPILVGPSRKSFIGYTLELPPEERMEGTAAAVAMAMFRNAAHIVRVHDVQAIVRVTRMVDAIRGAI